MAEQEQKMGIGKAAVVAIVAVGVAFIYFYCLDWFLMEVVQNLPFPYRPTK